MFTHGSRDNDGSNMAAPSSQELPRLSACRGRKRHLSSSELAATICYNHESWACCNLGIVPLIVFSWIPCHPLCPKKRNHYWTLPRNQGLHTVSWRYDPLCPFTNDIHHAWLNKSTNFFRIPFWTYHCSSSPLIPEGKKHIILPICHLCNILFLGQILIRYIQKSLPSIKLSSSSLTALCSFWDLPVSAFSDACVLSWDAPATVAEGCETCKTSNITHDIRGLSGRDPAKT